MAKMFYTLEEAAAKLGMPEDQVKQLAASGKLQQFRDRDKLMFKREQVDSLSKSPADDSGGPLPSLKSGDTDAIDLAAETKAPPRREDPRHATGISVFEAGEVKEADPMAQTQVNPAAPAEDDLALESVGSGSGLLDLTRESDDTSLGAELLDEIYPGGGEGSDIKVQEGAVPSSPGALEGSAAGLEAGSGSSGLENMTPVAVESVAVTPVIMAPEAYDPSGSGLSSGFLMGATIALFVGLIIAIFAVLGVPSNLIATVAKDSQAVMMYTGILLVLSIVLGIAGWFIGRMQER